MSDVRIREMFSLEGPTMDWFLRKDGTLDEREELASAVRLALGTDSLADVNEILPDPDSTDRRGWWADMDAETIWGGWPVGCKNWLLTRTKIVEAPSSEGSTLQRAKQYTQQALQPLIDKRIATRIDIQAARTELNRIEVHATIYRGPKMEIDLRYQLLWEEAEAVEDDYSVPVNHKVRVPYANLLLSSTAILDAGFENGLLTNHRFLTIPQSNLELSSSSFTIGKIVPQGNVAVSPTAPTVRQNINRLLLQGNIALSPTPPSVVRGILFAGDMGTAGASFGTGSVTNVMLNVGASSPWTVPSNCVSVTVDCLGPGYGGGAGQNGGSAVGDLAGGAGGNGGAGGGGGGWARKNNSPVTPSSTIAFSIGAVNSAASTVFGAICTATGASGSSPGGLSVGDTGSTGGAGGGGGAGTSSGLTGGDGGAGGSGGTGGPGSAFGGGGGGGGSLGAGGTQFDQIGKNGGNAGNGAVYGSGGGGGGGGGGGDAHDGANSPGGGGGSAGAGQNGVINIAYTPAVLSQAMTTTAAAPAGSTVVVGICLNTNNGVTVASVSDGTNTYTRIDTTGLIGGVSEVSLWRATLGSQLASGSTITATFSGGASGSGCSCNFSAGYMTGLSTGVTDKFGHVSASSGTSVSIATGTLTQAIEMIIGFGGDISGLSSTVYNGASGFNNLNKSSSPNGVTALDWKIVSATSTITFTPSWGSATRMGAVVASFKG